MSAIPDTFAGIGVPTQPAPTLPPVAGPGPRDPYVRAHLRCRAVRGRASRYRCVDCRDRAAQDWALVEHPVGDLHVVMTNHKAMWFSDDIYDYEPKCRSCHRAEDCRRRLEFEAQWEQVLSPVPYQRDDEFEGWWYR